MAELTPVAAWLRTDEGGLWSRAMHAGSGTAGWVAPPQVLWRATGPLDVSQDPAGAPPLAGAATAGGQA